MQKLTKEDINQEVFNLYDDCAPNKIERRHFVEKLPFYAVGIFALPSLLSFIRPNYLDSILIKADDLSRKSEFITYNFPKGRGQIKGLLYEPLSGKKKLPLLIVVYENRGLNPHIQDVGRRPAVEEFISLAPDALSPSGGYPGHDDATRELQKKRSRQEMLKDFIVAYEFLEYHKDGIGQIVVVGFCFGEWIAPMMAVRIPALHAAVPYCGGRLTPAEAQHIKTPLLFHYAGIDTRVNQDKAAFETIRNKNKVENTAFIDPAVNHGFHNNTTTRHDKAAATL